MTEMLGKKIRTGGEGGTKRQNQMRQKRQRLSSQKGLQ